MSNRKDSILTSTEDISKQEWLQYRRRGVGGSDMPIIAGVSRWGSEYELYLQKREEIEDEEIDNRFVEAGNYLEDPIAGWAADKLREYASNPRPDTGISQEILEQLNPGLKVQNRHAIYQHPERNFHLGNVDREILNTGMGIGVLEIKNTSTYRKNEWFDGDEPDLPPEVTVQVMHYLAFPWYDFAVVAGLIGGNQLELRYVEKDEELISDLAEIEQEFWSRVEEGNPPEIDGSDAAKEAIAKEHPELDDEEYYVEGDEADELSSLIQTLDEVKDELDKLEDTKDRIKNKIMKIQGDRKKLVVPTEDGERTVSQISSTREYLDKDTVLNEFPEVSKKREKFFNESETRYIRVYG